MEDEKLQQILWLHPDANREQRRLAISAVEEAFPGLSFIVEIPTTEEVTMLRKMLSPDATDEEFWQIDIALLFEGETPMELAWNRKPNQQDETFMLLPKSHLGMMDDN